MKKILSSFVLLFAIVLTAQATHLMGGEITWKCIKSGPNYGKYIFQVKVYRDCQGVPISTSMNLDVHNVPGITTLPLTWYTANDLSPTCDTLDGINSPYSCNGINIGYAGNGVGAVEEHIYISDTVRLIGTPDSLGWHFTWSSCCRNLAITNLTNAALNNTGFTLRAVMYPYTDSTGIVYPENNNCYDSSPKFYEKPRTILEAGNGYDPLAFSNGFVYSHNAFDEERDSLYYQFAEPLSDIPYNYMNPAASALQITGNYPPYPTLSNSSPIPGVQINNNTGRTYYPADYVGNFVTCTKVEAWKCNQLVSEVFREIQVVLSAPICNLGDTTNGNIGADTLCNIRPLVQPPFFFPTGSPQYQWDTIVHCGDTVSFDFIANDYDVYANGSLQDLQFTVSGGQFLDYNSNPPVLCDNPPCATFNEISTGAVPPFTTVGGTGTGYFEWVTSCNHLVSSCDDNLRPSLYTFIIKVQDDFCPAPAIENTAQVVSIWVCPPCDLLKANPTSTPVTCALGYGSANVNPSFGFPPYYDFWFDMNGIPVNPDSLIAGDYQVRVRDSSMCETIDTVTVGSLVANINLNISTANTSCNGYNDGSASIIVNGGAAPYSYLWSNGASSSIDTNLLAGIYTVTITDSNNCTVIDSIIITEPDSLSPILNVSANSITGNANGGVMPYVYEFWGPSGFVAASFNNFGTSFTINPLTSGNYTLVVIDANGCTDSIDVVYSGNFSPTVLVSISNTLCDSLSDLTIQVSQDSGEVDMSSALFQSNAGSFDISSMNVGDTIGTATMMAGGGSININAILIVSTIISSTQVIIQPTSLLLGSLGNFTLTNISPSGVEISSQTVPDGNSYTSGNFSTIVFNNIFINPCVSLNFTSTIDSELGDIDVQSFNFIVSDIIDNNIEVEIFPNPVNDILNIRIDRLLDSFTVDLYEISGKKIISSYKFTNNNMATIDLSYLKSSIYMLVISNELGLTTNLFFKK